MKSWFDFRFYLILALIGISSYLTFRLSKIENSIVERVTVDTLYVTKDTTIFKNGKTIFRTKVDTVEIPVYIDTTGVIKDYYTKYVYSDTLNFNEHGSIVLKDTITQNSIQNRLIDANLSTVYITKEITKTQTPKVEYYIGGGVGLGGQNFLNNMTGSILIRSKKRTLYGIEGGLTTSPLENIIKPYFGIKYYTPFR